MQKYTHSNFRFDTIILSNGFIKHTVILLYNKLQKYANALNPKL